MRKDMDKVLCERPRAPSRLSYHSLRASQKTVSEDLPSRGGIKSPYRGNYKNLNENLSPLRRYLNSKIGQKWDDVYSEIRSNFNMRSAVGLHIFQHIPDFVSLKVVEREGKLLEVRRWGFYEMSSGHLYVDASGILRKHEVPKRAKKVKPKLKVVAGEITFARKTKDSPWFICEFKQVPEEYVKYAIAGRPYKTRVSYPCPFFKDSVVWPGEICIRYRQASKKELKLLKPFLDTK